jgi:cell division protein FtsX
MNMVQATISFIILEFVTVFTWFALVIHMKDVINLIVSASAGIAPQAVSIGQNVINAFNVLFLVLIFMWLGWYAYMAHAIVNEATYLSNNEIRRF